VEVFFLAMSAMKPPTKPPTMELEARHEAADAAAWPLVEATEQALKLRVSGWGS
jgi:hypothetical protein